MKHFFKAPAILLFVFYLLFLFPSFVGAEEKEEKECQSLFSSETKERASRLFGSPGKNESVVPVLEVSSQSDKPSSSDVKLLSGPEERVLELPSLAKKRIFKNSDPHHPHPSLLKNLSERQRNEMKFIRMDILRIFEDVPFTYHLEHHSGSMGYYQFSLLLSSLSADQKNTMALVYDISQEILKERWFEKLNWSRFPGSRTEFFSLRQNFIQKEKEGVKYRGLLGFYRFALENLPEKKWREAFLWVSSTMSNEELLEMNWDSCLWKECLNETGNSEKKKIR